MKACDKDRPSTWRKFDLKNCSSCQATCCQMPVEIRKEDVLRLGIATEDEFNHSIKKVARKLEQAGVIQSYRAGSELFMLTQKSNGDCYFLDSKTRLCTVYEARPDTCRGFPDRNSPRLNWCPYTPKS